MMRTQIYDFIQRMKGIVHLFGQVEFWKVVVLFAAVVALYIRTVDYDFVLDDKLVYSQNTYVQEGWRGIGKILTEESFAGYFRGQRNLVEGARYRPLSLVTFALEYEITGGAASWAHLINVWLYVLVVWMLYVWLRMLGWGVVAPWWRDVAYLASWLFALHPVHVEAVANVKGRDEILALLFGLGMLISVVRYYKSRRYGWLGGATLCFVLAVLSKEHAVVLAVLAPLMLWTFFGWPFRRVLRLFAYFMLWVGVYIGWRIRVIGYFLQGPLEFQSLINNPFLEMDTTEKWATIAYVLLKYLQLLVFPHPLTHDYYPYHIRIHSWDEVLPVVSVVVYGLLLYWMWRGVWRRRWYGFFIAFYLLALLPVSNIFFTVGTFMNERFLFMPSVGFVAVLAKGLEGLERRYRYWGLGLFLVIALAYAFRTSTRIPAWKDEFHLNTAGIKVSRNSARLNLFVGVSYFKKALDESDRSERRALFLRAKKHFRRATDIYPEYYDAWRMRAGVAAELYKIDGHLGELLDEFDVVVQRYPRIPFVEEFIRYLLKREDAASMEDFLLRLGYNTLYRRMGNVADAYRYLAYGEGVARRPRYFRALLEVLDRYLREAQRGNTLRREELEQLLRKREEYREKAVTLN